MPNENILRTIPKVAALLEELRGLAEFAEIPHGQLVRAIRRALEKIRHDLLEGNIQSAPEKQSLLLKIEMELKSEMTFSLRPVINATGIILHTNLGRAVVSRQVAEHVAKVASSYSTLEYDEENGTRGCRHKHVENLLLHLTGAEAAMAVNNNAAAVLLILSVLFSGKELLVSRGELVEIGGAFRLPDIMKMGGTILKEVGCTNRTRISDYAGAISSPLCGGLLKVHTSNYRIIGFTEQVSMAELAELARKHGLPLVCDIGSGSFIDLQPLGIHDEPTVQQILAQGAELACFSGDKLMGGAQAGLIVGRKKYIEKLKAHPLARAVRIDKLTLAALEATLKLYLEPEEAKKSIPTLSMLFASPDELRLKAEILAKKLEPLPGLEVECVAVESQTGGGAAPERPLPSWAVSLRRKNMSPSQLEAGLRKFNPPIIARIAADKLIIDVRTIRDDEFGFICEALEQTCFSVDQ